MRLPHQGEKTSPQDRSLFAGAGEGKFCEEQRINNLLRHEQRSSLKVRNAMWCHLKGIISGIFFALLIKLELPIFLELKSKKISLLGYLKENVDC